MKTVREITRKITGLTNSNNYLSNECALNPAFAPVLHIIIADNNRQIGYLKEQLGGVKNG